MHATNWVISLDGIPAFCNEKITDRFAVAPGIRHSC